MINSRTSRNQEIKLLLISILLFIFTNGCGNNNDTRQEKTQKADHAAHRVSNTSDNYCDSVNNGLIAEDTMKGSPHRISMATVNGVHVHIEYSSPGVKQRIIWGGLVSYDKVWVTGAHHATSIQFNKEVVIANQTIPPGIYGFFTIPGKSSWTIILNSHYDQHLADEYNEKEDILRLMVTPERYGMTQRLTYQVDEVDARSGLIIMTWEKLQISVPFKTSKE